MYKRLQIKERDVKEMDFNSDPDRLKLDYLVVFERVKLEIFYTAKYNNDCDIGNLI